MPNEKVSQLSSLSYLELSPEDLFLITDMSARESKKISTSDILSYISNTGSFNTVHSNTSDTSSHILGTNVNGLVSSSSYSQTGVSSSYSLKSSTSDTSSYSTNAQSIIGGVQSCNTASYLNYTGNSTGTASYSLNSNLSLLSQTASLLLYVPGTTFNTSSFSISSSYSVSSSNSISSSYSLSSSFTLTSSFSLNTNVAVKAVGEVSWSIGVNYPLLIQQKNISTIIWLSTTVISSTFTKSLFGVSFENPVSSSNYIMSSNVGYGGTALLNPISTNRTATSFTMSLLTTDLNWYSYSSTSERGYMSFSILQL